MASHTPSQPDAAPPATKPGLGSVLLRRFAVAIVLLLVLIVPSFGLMAATGQPAATYAGLATIIGVVAVMGGGLRIGVITAVVVALLAPLAVLSGLTPITGAALMAIMTMTVGRLSTFGLHRATMLVPVLLAWPMLAPVPWLPKDKLDQINDQLTRRGSSLADALTAAQTKGGASATGNASAAATGGSGGSGGDVTNHLMTELRMDSTYLTWLVLFFFVGAIVPVIVAALLRRRLPAPDLTPHPRRETVPYTAVITILAGVATYYFLSHPKEPGGAFLIAAILVLTQVGNDVAWRLTVQRVVGTLLGVVLFTGVNALVGTTKYVELLGLPFPLEIYLIGIVFAIVALMAKFGPHQWLYYLLIVPTTAYLNAFTVGDAAGLGKARLIDNIVGAILVLFAALITLGASRVYGRRFPASAEESVQASPA